MTVSKNWCELDIDINTKKPKFLNCVFENHREEDEKYTLTTIEIAETECKDQELKVYFKKNAKTPKKDMHFHHIEDTKVHVRMVN